MTNKERFFTKPTREQELIRTESGLDPDFENYLRKISLKIIFGQTPCSAFFELISRFPQKTLEGNLIYLLSSGLAVDLLTQNTRRHRDIDLVMVNGWGLEKHFRKVDVTSGQSFCNGMSFEDSYLVSTAKKIEPEKGGEKTGVWIVHPAIILVQKLSDRGNKLPRGKDIEDAKLLIGFFNGLPNEEQQSWRVVIRRALESFGDDRLYGIVNKRLHFYERIFSNF